MCIRQKSIQVIRNERSRYKLELTSFSSLKFNLKTLQKEVSSNKRRKILIVVHSGRYPGEVLEVLLDPSCTSGLTKSGETPIGASDNEISSILMNRSLLLESIIFRSCLIHILISGIYCLVVVSVTHSFSTFVK